MNTARACRKAALTWGVSLVLAGMPLLGATLQAKSQKPAATAVSASWQVTPDLARRVAEHVPFQVRYDPGHLTPRQRKLVQVLLRASQDMEAMYWRQMDPPALDLVRRLQGSANAQDKLLLRALLINGSRYDLLDGNHPLLGSAPMSPDGGFYSRHTSRKDLEAFWTAHPRFQTELQSPYTLVRRQSGAYFGVPYHREFGSYLQDAARRLREAATLSSSPSFARFLRLRAQALLNDHYLASDVAWLQVKNTPIDIIFAPYEVYDDHLLGVKTAYEAGVLLVNQRASARLRRFQAYIPALQRNLPIPAQYKPNKQGLASPMEVVDRIYSAGDLLHGYQAVADNLPNDPRVLEKYGSKRMFFQNFMNARVNYVILPIARRLMTPDQVKLVSGDAAFTFVMLHEISHGLGPSFATVHGQKLPITQAMGPIYSALEESKADVTGMFDLAFLIKKGVLPAAQLPAFYASYLAQAFRTVRFGTAEAHGLGQIMEFNFLAAHGAIVERNGRYAVDVPRMTSGFAALDRKLLMLEATGDRAGAQRWFQRYGTITPALRQRLATLTDIPIDVDPRFPFPTPIR